MNTLPLRNFSIYSPPTKMCGKDIVGTGGLLKLQDINSHYPPSLTVTKRLRNGYDTTTTRQRHDNDIVERHCRNYDISNLDLMMAIVYRYDIIRYTAYLASELSIYQQ